MTSDRTRLVGLAGLLAAVATAVLGACNAATPVDADLRVEAPGTLRAEPLGPDRVRLAWTRRVRANADFLEFRVERREDLAAEFTTIGTVGRASAADTLTFLDVNVRPGTFYGYRVTEFTALGAGGQPSNVAGVRTPPPPGIRVRMVTQGQPAWVDPNGYLVRLEGPDTASRRVPSFITAGGINAGEAPSALFEPLRPGAYRVVVEPIAANCGIVEAGLARTVSRDVVVVGDGLDTRREVALGVECADPSLGTIVADVAVTGGSNAAPFTVRVAGAPGGVATLRDVTVPDSGGVASVRNLRPGSYQVDLRNVAPRCRVVGATSQAATVVPASVDTVRFTVDCRPAAGEPGVFDPTGTDCAGDDPAKPYKLRLSWVPVRPAVGDTVTLAVGFEASTTPFALAATDFAVGDFRNAPLRYIGGAPVAPFSGAVGNAVAGGSVGVSVANPAAVPSTETREVARLRFVVTEGSAGRRYCTRTVIDELIDPSESDFRALAIATGTVLEIAGAPGNGTAPPGGGSPPPGGGTNPGQLPPTAVIAGPAVLNALAGVPVTLSSAGTSDPSGSSLQYLWTLPGATPSTSTALNPTVTYAAPGTYPITLTVRNSANLQGQATKNIVVGVAQPNQPPEAIILGGTTLQASLGVPLELDGSLSRDPDGTIARYTWSMPGGQPSTASGPRVQVTYNTAGVFEVELTVEDAAGARSSARKPVLVTAAVDGRPFALYQRFGPVRSDDTVLLSLYVDLTADLPQTPLPEALQTLRMESLSWDPAVLTIEAFEPLNNISTGPTAFPEANLGRVSQPFARFVGDGRGGFLEMMRIRFRVRRPIGTTPVTITGLRMLPTAQAGAGIILDYAPFTSVEEGRFPPPPGGDPVPSAGSAPTTGVVRGTVTRTGTGTQSLTGIAVRVTPAGGSAVVVGVTGAAASVAYQATVPTAVASGGVELVNLPSGCQAPAARTYAGLSPTSPQTVDFAVECGAVAPATGTVQGTITRSGAGTQSLAGVRVRVTPTGLTPVTVDLQSGAGGTLSFTAPVPAGDGTGAVSLIDLPTGCTTEGAVAYSGLAGGAAVTVSVPVTCAAPAAEAAFVLRSQFGAVVSGSVDLTVTFDPSACLPAANPACPSARAFSGMVGEVVLEGAAASRVTARSAQPTPNFGVAILGGTLPTIRWTSFETSSGGSGFTTAQQVAILRLTVGAGAPGTLTTRSALSEVADPDGSPLPLALEGSGRNLVIVEGALTLP